MQTNLPAVLSREMSLPFDDMSDKLKRNASAAASAEVEEEPIPALLSEAPSQLKKHSRFKRLTVLGRASLLMAAELVRLLLLCVSSTELSGFRLSTCFFGL